MENSFFVLHVCVPWKCGESLIVKHIFQFRTYMKTMGLKHQSKHRPHHTDYIQWKWNETNFSFVLKITFDYFFFPELWISLVLFNIFFFFQISRLKIDPPVLAKHNFKCSNRIEFHWTLLCQRHNSIFVNQIHCAVSCWGHWTWDIIRIAIIYYLPLTMIGNWQL